MGVTELRNRWRLLTLESIDEGGLESAEQHDRTAETSDKLKTLSGIFLFFFFFNILELSLQRGELISAGKEREGE